MKGPERFLKPKRSVAPRKRKPSAGYTWTYINLKRGAPGSRIPRKFHTINSCPQSTAIFPSFFIQKNRFSICKTYPPNVRTTVIMGSSIQFQFGIIYWGIFMFYWSDGFRIPFKLFFSNFMLRKILFFLFEYLMGVWDFIPWFVLLFLPSFNRLWRKYTNTTKALISKRLTKAMKTNWMPA